MCLVPAPGQTQSRHRPSITPPPYSHRTGFVLDLFSFYLSFISPQQHRGKKNIECSWRWSYVLGRSLVEVPSTLRSNKTKQNKGRCKLLLFWMGCKNTVLPCGWRGKNLNYLRLLCSRPTRPCMVGRGGFAMVQHTKPF